LTFRESNNLSILPRSEYATLSGIAQYGLTLANYEQYQYSFADSRVDKYTGVGDINIPYGITHVGPDVRLDKNVILPPTVNHVYVWGNYDFIQITLGPNVTFANYSPGGLFWSSNHVDKFNDFYESNGGKAGTYRYNGRWTFTP
jgi:hypothetical protein